MFWGSRESSMAGVGPGQGDGGEQGTSLSWKPLKTDLNGNTSDLQLTGLLQPAGL